MGHPLLGTSVGRCTFLGQDLRNPDIVTCIQCMPLLQEASVFSKRCDFCPSDFYDLVFKNEIYQIYKTYNS